MMRRPPRSPLFPYTPLSRSAPARRAGVPRAPLHRHELQQLAVAPDEKVRRQLQSRDVAEIRMRGGVEPVGEQPLDRVAAVLPPRQADRGQHEEPDRRPWRTLDAL